MLERVAIHVTGLPTMGAWTMTPCAGTTWNATTSIG